MAPPYLEVASLKNTPVKKSLVFINKAATQTGCICRANFLALDTGIQNYGIDS